MHCRRTIDWRMIGFMHSPMAEVVCIRRQAAIDASVVTVTAQRVTVT